MRKIIFLLFITVISCCGKDVNIVGMESELASFAKVNSISPPDLTFIESPIFTPIDSEIKIGFSQGILESSIKENTFVIARIKKNEETTEDLISLDEIKFLKQMDYSPINKELSDEIEDLIDESLMQESGSKLEEGVIGSFSLTENNTNLIFLPETEFKASSSYLILIKGILDLGFKPIIAYVGIFRTLISGEKEENEDEIDEEESSLVFSDATVSELVINEVLADPGADDGDANEDGIRDSTDDEFVEIVNASSRDISLAGITICVSKTDSVKHTFENNALIKAGKAIVIFGGGLPPAIIGGSTVFVSQSPLKISNSGTTLFILNQGDVIDQLSFGSEGGKDQSMTRFPDITGEVVKHKEANEEQSFSPGKKVDGTEF